MPGYRGHMIGAAVAFAGVVGAVMWLGFSMEGEALASGLLFTFLGALFPDIDTKSKGQKLLYACVVATLVMMLIYKKYCGAIIVAIVSFLPLFVKHRGLFHKFWFALLVAISAAIACSLQFQMHRAAVHNSIFFLVGFVSHLVLDFGVVGIWRRW